MNKTFILLAILSLFSEVTVWGQASGGAIRRPVKKPVPSSSVTSQRSSANSQTSASTVRSQAAILAQLERDMIYVGGGTFQMGSNSGDNDEKTVHEVRVNSFRIAKTEVTQELWEAVMGTNPSHFEGKKKPIEGVSWDDCHKFILILNQLTGKRYRFPTETEWEFAARGGMKSKGFIYSGSNTLSNVAWSNDNSMGTTHNVGTKAPNELGIYDMSGNVSEWCQGYVFRGGGWFDPSANCRVTYRQKSTFASSYTGLRLAL